MIKKFLFLCFLIAVSVHSLASQTIYLQVRGDDPILKGNGPQRMPQRPFVVELDYYTLSFGNGFDEAVTVELLDEDENVVYTDWLAPGQTTLTFPDTLMGEYTIRLTVGSIYYIGVVEL